MIGNLFCFSGRIGRLKFFLWTVIFVPVILFLMLLILPFLFVFAFHFDGSKATALTIVLPALAVFFWMQLSLQVARIRDIGWKPLVIILALLFIDVADVIVAYFIPALAFETKHFTLVSAVVNAVFTIALFFTPTDGDYDIPAIVFPEIPLPKLRKGIFRSIGPDATKPVKPRRFSSEALRPGDARGKVSFGRRGLN